MKPSKIFGVQQFKAHPVHAQITALKEKFRAARTPEFRKNPTEIRSSLTRARWMLHSLERRFDNANAMEIAVGGLKQLAAYLAQLDTTFSKFAASPQANQVQFEAALDTVAERFVRSGMGIIPSGPPTDSGDRVAAMQETVDEVSKIVEDVREQASAANKEIETTSKSRIEKVAELESKVVAAQGALEKALAESKESTAGILQAAADAKKTVDELLGRMAETKAEIQAQKIRLDEFLNSASATNATSEAERAKRATDALEALRAEFQGQKARLDEFLNNTSSTNSAAETERTKRATEELEDQGEKFALALEDMNKRRDATLADLTKKFAESRAKAEAESTAVLVSIRKKLAEAEKVVGLVVDTVTTGNYEQVAKRELASARTMRLLAIGFFTLGAFAMVGLGLYFGITGNGHADLWTVLLRSLFGAVLFVPAGYCAREASRHWTSERAHRRIALELASIHPFVAPLPDEKRLAILEQRVTDYFGNKLPPEFAISKGGGKGSDHATELVGVINKLVENAKPGEQ